MKVRRGPMMASRVDAQALLAYLAGIYGQPRLHRSRYGLCLAWMMPWTRIFIVRIRDGFQMVILE